MYVCMYVTELFSEY